jgi:hypothetical protein
MLYALGESKGCKSKLSPPVHLVPPLFEVDA